MNRRNFIKNAFLGLVSLFGLRGLLKTPKPFNELKPVRWVNGKPFNGRVTEDYVRDLNAWYLNHKPGGDRIVWFKGDPFKYYGHLNIRKIS